jgi:hypothetical protein
MMSEPNIQMMPLMMRRITFAWLLISFALGLFLRWMFVAPVEGVNYKFLLHAHSHLALSGWVFGGFFLLLVGTFVPIGRRRPFIYLFVWMQVSLVGMFLSFPFQGYGMVSIAFTSLFLFMTYAFCGFLFKEVYGSRSTSAKMLRYGLWFLLISSLGPYGLAYCMTNELSGSHWYQNAIYFYLHFLYNGFFFWSLFALLIRAQEKQNQILPGSLDISLLVVSTWLTFFLSTLWMRPSPLFYLLGGIGGVVQFFLLIKWTLILGRNIQASSWMRKIVWSLACLILLKGFLQLVSVFPWMASWAYASKSFTIIGYIHLIMLGILTPVLILMLFPGFLASSNFGKISLAYLIGFIVTESLLSGRGAFLELGASVGYFPLLWLGYVLMTIAAISVFSWSFCGRIGS